MFQKLDLFPCSGEGRETPTLLGPLEQSLHSSQCTMSRNMNSVLKFICVFICSH
jgi:hypothetical protein